MSSGNRKKGAISYPNTRFQSRNDQVITPHQAGIGGIQAVKGNFNFNNLNNNEAPRANSAQGGASGQARGADRQQNNVNVNGNGAAGAHSANQQGNNNDNTGGVDGAQSANNQANINAPGATRDVQHINGNDGVQRANSDCVGSQNNGVNNNVGGNVAAPVDGLSNVGNTGNNNTNNINGVNNNKNVNGNGNLDGDGGSANVGMGYFSVLGANARPASNSVNTGDVGNVGNGGHQEAPDMGGEVDDNSNNGNMIGISNNNSNS